MHDRRPWLSHLKSGFMSDAYDAPQEAGRLKPTLLTLAPPKWSSIEHRSAQSQFDEIAAFVEAIMDAIQADPGEPDTWQSMYIASTVHALTQARFEQAICFAESVLTEHPIHESARALPGGGPAAVTLAQLRRALRVARTRTTTA